MAKNIGNGNGRRGAVTNRIQEPFEGGWLLRDRSTGQIIRAKAGKPFKGVTKR